MRCDAIVEHLQRRLPLLTDEFSTSIAIVSIVHAGTTATITTAAPHGLSVGQAPTIFGARTPVPVVSITHVPGQKVAVVTTSQDHDLTLYSTFSAGNVVEVDGANEVEFEGLRDIVAVPNRRTIQIAVDPAAPAAATGTLRLLGASSYLRNVRGRYEVDAIVSPTVFTVTHDAATNLGTLAGPAFLRSPARITGAISEQAAGDSYSEEIGGSAPKPWAFVVLGDSVALRNKEAPPEAYAVNLLSGGWSQSILQTFRVFVALPNANAERGRETRDLAEDLLLPMLRALLGAQFPTGLTASRSSSSVTFVGHGAAAGEAEAFYMHEYEFVQLAQITAGDTVGNEEHVAFRDISLALSNDVGPAIATAEIDLDDVPL